MADHTAAFEAIANKFTKGLEVEPQRLPLLLVDVKQASTILHCSRSLTYEMIARGEIDAIKLGRLTRIPLSALEAYIGSQHHQYPAGS